MKFLLTYGIETTDRHQGIVAACALIVCCIALWVAP